MKPSELMSIIFERPGLYIGYGSVYRMEYFLSGYICALQDANLDSKDNLYSGFSAWVSNRFGIPPTTHSWTSICTFHSLDESGAFDLARNLWEEYKIEREPEDD